MIVLNRICFFVVNPMPVLHCGRPAHDVRTTHRSFHNFRDCLTYYYIIEIYLPLGHAAASLLIALADRFTLSGAHESAAI